MTGPFRTGEEIVQEVEVRDCAALDMEEAGSLSPERPWTDSLESVTREEFGKCQDCISRTNGVVKVYHTQ